MEDQREVCLEEEVWRLRRAGNKPEEISARMGVDVSWVEQVLAMLPDEEYPGESANQER
ncbi:MAG TPA: hypothetical protein VFJ72_16240 [Rubrobacteraceae bacterium]|nr:hypothetical protein [Rubrobacteraceae bacterium]